jgi:hypothetical protein
MTMPQRANMRLILDVKENTLPGYALRILADLTQTVREFLRHRKLSGLRPVPRIENHETRLYALPKYSDGLPFLHLDVNRLCSWGPGVAIFARNVFMDDRVHAELARVYEETRDALDRMLSGREVRLTANETYDPPPGQGVEAVTVIGLRLDAMAAAFNEMNLLGVMTDLQRVYAVITGTLREG